VVTKLILTIIAIIALLVAGTGIVLPALPGIPVLWVLVAIDFWFLGYLELSGMAMFWLTFLTVLTVVIDNLSTSLGVKKRGGSTAGMIGSVIGLIVGMALLNVPGMLIGCFAGALAGELLHGHQLKRAAYIAVGALFGYATSVAVNLGIWLTYAVIIFYNIYA